MSSRPLPALIALVLSVSACGPDADPSVAAERLAPTCQHGDSPPHLDRLAELARALRDPKGVGPRVVQALASGPDQAIGKAIDKAMAELIPNLPEPLRGLTATDGILQAPANPGSIAVTIFAASLGCVQAGENGAGYVHHDTGWALGDSGCLQRTFGIDMRGATVNFRQERHGQPAYQVSQSKYAISRFEGNGTDLLLPIVGADGSVKAYLLHSSYNENYYDPATEQRRAILAWRERASACMASRTGK